MVTFDISAIERIGLLELLACEYRVTTEDSVTVNGNSVWGATNYTLKQIYLSRYNNANDGEALCGRDRVETFVHEVIHGVLDNGGYIGEAQNEALVEWLSKNMVKFIEELKKKEVI